MVAITEAIELHLDPLRANGEAVPPPTTRTGSVQVA
jgi:predicted RNase H-like HicB family nuclease